MSCMNISIIGLGLIGGSIARALKKNLQCVSISAYDLPGTTQAALSEQVIDRVLSAPEEAAESDIIFLCLPLQMSLDVFDSIAPRLKPGTILTDVCGVKGVFQEKWKNINSAGIFIGGHPMTGKEKSGYENSDPLLFENAVYILTAENESQKRDKRLIDIIQSLGARISFLDAHTHDRIVSSVSHLPQLLSVALVNAAAIAGGNDEPLSFAAGGFRDMTRIASSSFNIWKDVIRYNKSEIIRTIGIMEEQVAMMHRYIESDDMESIEKLFSSASVMRDMVPKTSKGFISPLYDIFVFVKDEPGIISRISASLFSEKINIKDIELLKIREGSGGTFRLSFESEQEMDRAREVLSNEGISVNL